MDKKSNEISAIPELLKIPAISGSIVTIDAMGTQTYIAQTIVDAQADYVLSVKENLGYLYEDISVLFAVDQAHDFKHAEYEYKKTVNKGHGRIEIRECYITSNPAYLPLIRNLDNWMGLKSIAMVVCTRIIGDKITKEVRYYISSLSSQTERILHAVRKHWSIENKLHWILDVALNDDHSQVRKDQLPKTWPFCATSPSTCSNRRKLPKAASMPNNFRLPGMMSICSRCLCIVYLHRIPGIGGGAMKIKTPGRVSLFGHPVHEILKSLPPVL